MSSDKIEKIQNLMDEVSIFFSDVHEFFQQKKELYRQYYLLKKNILYDKFEGTNLKNAESPESALETLQAQIFGFNRKLVRFLEDGSYVTVYENKFNKALERINSLLFK